MTATTSAPRNTNPRPLFDPKERTYTKPSLRAETTYSFYDRSAVEPYPRLRLMLQRWLDRLPPVKGNDIVERIRHKGPGSPDKEKQIYGAFFELFLHEFLLGTNAKTVETEPKIGKQTPDFGMSEIKPNGSRIDYVLEAIAPNTVAGTSLAENWLEDQALDVLDAIQSPDFGLDVDTKGRLSTMPPHKKLREPFEELIREAGHKTSATFQHGDWQITGHLLPQPPEHRPRKHRFISMGPLKVGGFDAVGKFKESLYAKAKAYREVKNLIIAVRADSWIDETHIEQALFGQQAIQYTQIPDPSYTGKVPPPRLVQKPNGFWHNATVPQNENVIGVVVFHHLYPHCIDQTTAMFYRHPYIDGQQLPNWADGITHAQYKADGTIAPVPGIPPGNFAKDHIPRTLPQFVW